MSTWRIYMSGSTRVHKCSHCPCMPEYGSESQTLCVYACICIWMACEWYWSMVFSEMKLIGADFFVVWIFYSFNNVLLVLKFIECLWGLFGCLAIITTLPTTIHWLIGIRQYYLPDFQTGKPNESTNGQGMHHCHQFRAYWNTLETPGTSNHPHKCSRIQTGLQNGGTDSEMLNLVRLHW